MSFGLGISFGRLCRLEKQRREAFEDDEPVLCLQTYEKNIPEDNFYWDNINSTKMDYEYDNKNMKIEPFVIDDNDGFIKFIKLYNHFSLDKICKATLLSENCF